jgi:hypothetical protein
MAPSMECYLKKEFVNPERCVKKQNRQEPVSVKSDRLPVGHSEVSGYFYGEREEL